MYTTYDIFDDVLRLRDVVDNFFNDIPRGGRLAEFPYVNLFDTGETIEVKAIVPGVVSDDLHIELVDKNLIIEGNRKEDLTDKPYVRRERSFGKFKKAIRLPYQVDRDKIAADLTNGILNITLQKSEAAKPKRITIN